jgi:hypothetical protein
VEVDLKSGLREFVNLETGLRTSKKPKRKGFKPATPEEAGLDKDTEAEEKEGVSESAVEVSVDPGNVLVVSFPFPYCVVMCCVVLRGVVWCGVVCCGV